MILASEMEQRFILYFDGLATVMGIMDLMTKEDEDFPSGRGSAKIHMSIKVLNAPGRLRVK